jgi:hypothetical protein
MMTSQIMAEILIEEADAPTFAHGEVAERPIPVPSARSMSERAAVTTAPAKTAAQDTLDVMSSFLTGNSPLPSCAQV